MEGEDKLSIVCVKVLVQGEAADESTERG